MSASEIMPSQGTSTFDVFALRFFFAAEAPVPFPAGETADLFRGQFGKILYRGDAGLYGRFFAPVASGMPSGLHDPPRPFVLRVRHLAGATLQRFYVGMNVFDTNPPLTAIRDAMAALGRESLRAELTGVEGQDPVSLSLRTDEEVERVRVSFLSPTELKNADRPEFGPLFARIRDRISTLRALYGSGPLEIDFASMGHSACGIRMTRCDLGFVDSTRVSRGSGHRHSLGGFTGIAEYEGPLTEFIPYLRIAAHQSIVVDDGPREWVEKLKSHIGVE